MAIWLLRFEISNQIAISKSNKGDGKTKGRNEKMIKRYVRKEMGEIWEDKNKYRKWLEVEMAVLRARAKIDLDHSAIKAEKHIRENAKFTVERIEELDREIEHDMIAFITAVQENLDSKYAGEFHKGLTSYDIEEPATALLMMESADIIIENIELLIQVILEKAKEHKETIMIGRTHGQHAQPITFGLKLLNWHYSLENDLELVKQAKEVISYGKISGAVGTYTLSPEIENFACWAVLRINPAKISTQILQRDRHAQMMSALAITAATVEQIATEIRILSQTEIGEVREPFKKKQKGSSAMPHKKNPIICERLCGQARIIRANLMAAIENIAVWSERDISQSSVERVIFPDSFQLLDYMLAKLTWVIQGLEVFPENMRANLEKTYGVIASGEVKTLLLNKGVEPEKAYRLVQDTSFIAINEKKTLMEVLLTWDKTADYFESATERQELSSCFEWKNQLQYIDQIFERFGVGKEKEKI